MKSWTFPLPCQIVNPAVLLSDWHDGYARSNAHRAHRGQVPDGRAMETQRVLRSEIDVVGGKGCARVRIALEFDEVVRGFNRIEVVSGAVVQREPLIPLIRRILETSQVRECQLTAATQSDGVKTEGRGADGREGRVRRGPCHCIVPGDRLAGIQRVLERTCEQDGVVRSGLDLAGSRIVRAS